MKVAIVHDTVAQYGGAERVLLHLLEAFPDAPVYTAIFDPEMTYQQLRVADVRPLGINRVGLIRRNHRIALPLLAWAYSRLTVEADVVFCCSWGWAHGARVSGRKVVYCYTPARWLYQSDRYVGHGPSLRKAALLPLRGPLTRWDRRQAASAHRYVTLSTAVQQRIADLYGRESEVLAPPPGLPAQGSSRPLDGLQPGFWLCPSRFLPYKNVDAVVKAFRFLPEQRLVVVGTGPQETKIRAVAGSNVMVRGLVSDPELRWLYQNCNGVVAASYEDYGLTPLEAATFGKPAAVLRWGGFLDTVAEGVTGTFFDAPEAPLIAEAVAGLGALHLSAGEIERHARQFSADRFKNRMKEIAAEEADRL